MAGKLFDLMSTQLARRAFLARGAKAGFAAAAALTGVALEEMDVSASCLYSCTDYNCCCRSEYCCSLGYCTDCSDLSCFNCNHKYWVWTCCWNRGTVAMTVVTTNARGLSSTRGFRVSARQTRQ
jgi:hypothetical protein